MCDTHLARYLSFSTLSKLTMDESKKRKVSGENRMLNATWVDSFFILSIKVKKQYMLLTMLLRNVVPL